MSVSIEKGWRLLSRSVDDGGFEGSHNYATWDQSMDSRVSTKLYHGFQLKNVSHAVEKQLASIKEEGTACSSSTEAAWTVLKQGILLASNAKRDVNATMVADFRLKYGFLCNFRERLFKD
ncbi:hypothetical protein ERJ75_001713600 [Trypanosoma vivax]|nr:hypothetical protein ERJ75_001713600 [Trypanosoma vivax]